jgi:hypothetical protein
MRSGSRGRKPFEDQVSSDISDVVQAPKSDLMTRGVAVDLFKVANPIGTQSEAAEHKKLTGGNASSEIALLLMIERAIEPLTDDTGELSMKAPMSVSKLADLG